MGQNGQKRSSSSRKARGRQNEIDFKEAVDPQEQFLEFQLCWGTCSPRRQLRFKLFGRSLACLEVELGPRELFLAEMIRRRMREAGLKPNSAFS